MEANRSISKHSESLVIRRDELLAQLAESEKRLDHMFEQNRAQSNEIHELQKVNLRQRVEDLTYILRDGDSITPDHFGTLEIMLHEIFGGSIAHLFEREQDVSVKDILDWIEQGVT